MKSRKHILIVDDVTTNIRFLGEVLKDEYSLSMAKSGKQALKILEKTLPDLILLDVKMPDMDGYETFSKIKENSKTTNIPVIFLSADFQKENEEKGLKLGASAFIRKPFVPDALLLKVKDILNEQAVENEIQVLANSDSLTGLWNRKYLEKNLKTVISDGQSGLFILLNFSPIISSTDISKELTEEALLKTISNCISTSIHSSDIACRIGGYEFAVYQKNDSSDNVEEKAGLLISNVKSALSSELKTISDNLLLAGICEFPQNGLSFAELYNNADKAIEYSKENSEVDYYFYNTNISKNSNNIVEVSQLQSIIESDDTLAGPMIVDYSDFKDIYRFMKRYAERTGEKFQLVLFTLKDLSGNKSNNGLLKCMNLLETSIRSTLRKNDAATKYTDTQFIVILSDLSYENRNEVIQRVTECFESTSDDSSIILKVDIDDTVLDSNK